jgi:hypothetical protein
VACGCSSLARGGVDRFFLSNFATEAVGFGTSMIRAFACLISCCYVFTRWGISNVFSFVSGSDEIIGILPAFMNYRSICVYEIWV